MIFLTDKNVRVKTGCFDDTLEQFINAVNQKADKDPHKMEYKWAIMLIHKHVELWGVKEEITA